MFERRDIEIAGEHDASVGDALGFDPFGHFVEKIELMREFWIDRRIRFVAAGGHIKIMHFQRRAAGFQLHRDMPRMTDGAKIPVLDHPKRMFRGDGDAVIALLAVDREMPITQRAKIRRRKLRVAAFGFL